MNPNKRLDQIEPVVADVAQKTDRLIESNGHILEIALRADANAELAARGVANLTIEMRQQFEQVNQRFDQQQAQTDERFNSVDQRFDQQQIQIDERFDSVNQQFDDQKINIPQRFDQQQSQIDELREEMREGFSQVNRKFDQVSQTQHQILTILLDRLK
ncbi:hypothetical protein GCM10028805_10920 [Spirosoma harenae]